MATKGAVVVLLGLIGFAMATSYNSTTYPYASLPLCSTFTDPADIFTGSGCTWVCQPKQAALDGVWSSVGKADACATTYDREGKYTEIMGEACRRTVASVDEVCMSSKMAAMTVNEVNFECHGTPLHELLPVTQASGMLAGCATTRRQLQVAARNMTESVEIDEAARPLELCEESCFHSHITYDPADFTTGTNNCVRLCLPYHCDMDIFSVACFNYFHASDYWHNLACQILGAGHPDVQACFQNYDNTL